LQGNVSRQIRKKTTWIQHNNALPPLHKIAEGKLKIRCNEVGADRRFYSQLAHFPDLNICNLSFLHSDSTAFYKTEMGHTMAAIVSAVLCAFEEYSTNKFDSSIPLIDDDL
jgi:hypothetical protein